MWEVRGLLKERAGARVEIMGDFDSELQLLTNLYGNILKFDQSIQLYLYQLNISLVNI